MKLLKLTIVILFINSPVVLFAQVGINITGGGNLSKINAIDRSNYKVTTMFKPGFQVGLSADIPLGRRALFYPGIAFVSKGYKSKNATGITTLNANFIELPLSVLYKMGAGQANILVGAGPYVAYGLGGKWNFKKSNLADPTEYLTHGPIEFLNDYATRKTGSVIPYGRPIDLGGNVILGYERGSYKILFDGQLGLINLEPYEDGLRPIRATQQTIGLKLQFVYKLFNIN